MVIDHDVKEGTVRVRGPGQKVGIINKVIDIISGIFVPFIYTLVACGILQGILSVLIATGIMNSDMGTYKMLNFISWTAFTFLPVLISISAAKKFKVNEFIAVIIACALISPDYINMVDTGQSLSFLGLNIQMVDYSLSVIPIIIAIWIASYLEKFFMRKLPSVVRNLFTPMLIIGIIVPATLLIFGPFGNVVGDAIGDVYKFLYNLSPIIAGIIVGGFWQVLVIFGVHWGVTPVSVGNYATLGYSTFTGLQASSVFGQAGASLGVFFKTKDKAMKEVSLPAAVTALFGITEPAIYGVTLRLKNPMICGCISGAIGGGIAGGFRAYSWVYNVPGIATIPAFFKEGYMNNFIGFLISIVVSFVVGMILTMIIGFEEGDDIASTKMEGTKELRASALVLNGVVKGEVVKLKSVSDQAFASGALGDGVGIIPSEGKIYAPCDGVVRALFPSKHAIGILSNDGVEILIHIGIDTVHMEGEGFEAHTENGRPIKKGDLLVTFSIDEIKKAGYDTTVMVVVTNVDEYSDVISCLGLQDDLNGALLEVFK